MLRTSDSMDRMHEAIVSGIATGSVGWVSLPRYPHYFIGFSGQVVSVRKRKPVTMRPQRMGEYDGYVLYDASGKPRHEYRHRLVAEAMHGPCPDGMECRHLDGNKSNADASNLRWGTHLENEADKHASGTRTVGERSGRSKLTEAEVTAMRRMRVETGKPYHAIAKAFGVTTMTAHRAIKGKNWSHLS